MTPTIPLTGGDFEKIIRECFVDAADLPTVGVPQPFPVYPTTLVEHASVQVTRRSDEVDIKADD